MSDNVGWSGSGHVQVRETSAGLLSVELINVVATKDDARVTGEFIGHVHNAACTNGDSGGHWQVVLMLIFINFSQKNKILMNFFYFF